MFFLDLLTFVPSVAVPGFLSVVMNIANQNQENKREK
jgi:hypothetical protein